MKSKIVVLIIWCCLALACQIDKKQENLQESTQNFKQYNTDEDYMEFFKKLREIATAHEDIWDTNIYGPLVLVDSKTRNYIANTNPEDSLFTTEIKCFRGKFQDDYNLPAAHTTISWKGKKWAKVNLPLSNFPKHAQNLCLHEMAHVAFWKKGYPGVLVDVNHLAKADARLLMRLELELLKKHLKSNASNNHLLKDALAIRSLRWEKYPRYKEQENSLELNEGLTEYTSTKMANFTVEELDSFLMLQLDNYLELEVFNRQFAYFTIPIYGRAMDEIAPTWISDLTPETDLTEYFMEKLQMRNSIDHYIEKYDFHKIVEAEQKFKLQQQRVIDSIANIFTNNPLLEIPNYELGMKAMERGESAEYSMGSNGKKAKKRVLKNLGSHFEGMQVTACWGSLDVNNGILLTPDFKKIYITQPTKIEGDTILGDGYKLSLHNKYQMVKESDSLYTIKEKE